MLQITERAAEQIERLRPAYLPDHRIARIACRGEGRHPTARLSFVARAREGDRIAGSRGVEMSVSQELVDLLDDAVLDVREDASATFYVRPAAVPATRGAGPIANA